MKYRIVEGNGFKLHILVSKLCIAQNNNAIADCNMNRAANIKVELIDGCGDGIRLKHKVSDTAANELVCDFPGNISVGCYSVKVSWEAGGTKLSSCESNLFAVVPYNRQARLPLGVIDGEPCGLYNLRYYITTGGADSSGDYRIWWGSSSADGIDTIDKDKLSFQDSSLAGKSVTIATTDGQPRVWFICSSPIIITQAGLPTFFNTAQADGLYYYWSDELVAGGDNIYTVTDY